MLLLLACGGQAKSTLASDSSEWQGTAPAMTRSSPGPTTADGAGAPGAESFGAAGSGRRGGDSAAEEPSGSGSSGMGDLGSEPALQVDADCGPSACRHGGSCIESQSFVACSCPSGSVIAFCGDVYFRALGTLNGAEGALWGEPNANGMEVLGSALLPLGRGGLRIVAAAWTLERGITLLDAVSGFDATTSKINSDGSVMALSLIWDGRSHPTRLQNGQVEELPLAPGAERALVYGLSADGNVIAGTFWTAGDPIDEFGTRPFHPFRWVRGEGSVDLDPMAPDALSSTHALSADGSVVVGSMQRSAPGGIAVGPFIWSVEAGMQALPVPAGDGEVVAIDVSADGAVVLGVTQQDQLLLWTEGELEVVAGLGLVPSGLSDDGSVVVGRTSEAAIWTRNTGARPIRALLEELGVDLEGWSLDNAWAVSANGKAVVGEGKYQTSAQYWIAWLP